MNRRITGAALGAALVTATVVGAVELSTSASASTATHHEHFRIYSGNVNDKDLTEVFRGVGPVSGVGVAAPDDDVPGDAIPIVVTMPKGDKLYLTAHGPFTWKPNLKTCTATEHNRGTFEVTGGTGRYRHARGRGKYVENGAGIGNRDADGNCQQSFKINYVVVDASGTIRL
jgi:hypothetical protein